MSIEARFVCADGSHRWMGMTLRGTFDDAGELLEVHSSRHDITARRDADELRDQWEQTFKHTSRGIVVMDNQGEAIQSVNPAFARMLRANATELVGMPVMSFIAEDYRDAAAALRQGARPTATRRASSTSCGRTARRCPPMLKLFSPAIATAACATASAS